MITMVSFGDHIKVHFKKIQTFLNRESISWLV